MPWGGDLFVCEICGKRYVDRPGGWCSKCQERERDEDKKSAAEWYNRSRLCQACDYCWGPDPGDMCGYYMMPLYMTKRKNKCKHFKKRREVIPIDY